VGSALLSLRRTFVTYCDCAVALTYTAGRSVARRPDEDGFVRFRCATLWIVFESESILLFPPPEFYDFLNHLFVVFLGRGKK